MINEAIGVVEFMSVATGIEVTDKMLKAAEVKLLKTSTMCPGKYLTIIYGSTSNVNSSINTAINEGGEYVVDVLEIDNISPQVVPAIAQSGAPESVKALGIMEFYSATSGILAADSAVKAASVDLIEIRLGYAVGGKGIVLLTGDLEAVKTAVKAGAAESDMRFNTSVIARPEMSLIEELM